MQHYGQRALLAAWIVAMSSAGCAADDPLGDEEISMRRFAAGSCGGTVPQVPRITSAIDTYASYSSQTTCDPTARPGLKDFRALILKTYPCTRDLGITRACSVGSKSEHKEGRAWDWGVHTSNPAGKELLTWLLKTDRQGNMHAMARRFGIMYMIYDRKIWGAYRAKDGWRAYTGSSPHTDHVHFSFAWKGANRKTSYWTGKTAPKADARPPRVDAGAPDPDTQRPSADSMPTADFRRPKEASAGGDLWRFYESGGAPPPFENPSNRLEGGCAFAGPRAETPWTLWILGLLTALRRRRARR